MSVTWASGRVPPGDIRDHHVQPRPVREHRVDERRREVHPPTGRLQHPLDELADLRRAEDGVRQLRPTGPRDEHATWLVDPYLLDGRVVEVALQRTESGDRVVQETCRMRLVRHGWQAARQRPLVVVGQDVVDQPTDRTAVDFWVQPASPDELTDLTLDDPECVHVASP